MFPNHYISLFRQYWANERVNYSIRVFLALVGVTVPCWHFQAHNAITPLVLGIIASALAETDDSFTGRLKAQIITLVCFAIATFSIEILFPYPWLFATGLALSTFGFIMLGSVGLRYASIAFASLLIAVYTMLGAAESTILWWQPALLLAGATWYGLLSLIWNLLWPHRPLQQGMAGVFAATANYLEVKSELFLPVRGMVPQPLRLETARLNAKVVTSLNQAKLTLLVRARRGRLDRTNQRLLKTYFLAQDIHERISSSHYRYQDLAEYFLHSDVLFRFRHLILMQAAACRSAATAFTLSKDYQHSEASTQALNELRESLDYLAQTAPLECRNLLTQLEFLFRNLATVERQLANIGNPDAIESDEDNTLADEGAHTLKDKWHRIWSQMTPKSLRFRHAVRLSVVLVAGYAILQGLQLERGYWILLTILFVCQPSYSATRSKLVERVIGTVAGLLVGIPLLYFFSDPLSQIVLMVITGVMFFAFRTTQYAIATAFITLLVLLCFNQLGEGYAVILPRLSDTLIGCLLSVIAVRFILPDWQAHRLRGIMSDALETNQQYLAQIIGQYRIGKRDNLAYRIARRNAHNADTELTTAISNMLAEPGRYRSATDESFRFLCLNNAMLSYISALGAHRMQLGDEALHHLVSQAHREIYKNLNCLIESLADNPCSEALDQNTELEKHLESWRDEDNPSLRLVLQQLYLINRMMPELHSLTGKLTSRGLQHSSQ
ncbi:YccS family putative transporter [Parasalinivibrio latis]|uniref:YccS family putative transporter n=1 Tax=Parasalinivibrio latis TaxID=2952610 RepID=UPI0030E24C38